jgi:hypothetical protein
MNSKEGRSYCGDFPGRKRGYPGYNPFLKFERR